MIAAVLKWAVVAVAAIALLCIFGGALEYLAYWGGELWGTFA